MLLLGIDIGTSSIKASVVDGETGQLVTSAQYPDTENTISSPLPDWAEQDPEMWWNCAVNAIQRCNNSGKYNPKDIQAIGIAYQMHGLVMVDRNHSVLRPSIIWCDSRAVEIGNKAFQEIGEDKCLSHLLNSPGNFTASKLAWVKANEPKVYGSIYKIMLPGDFIAMKLTNAITTSNSALSEGIFWDFKENSISEDILKYYGFPKTVLPDLKPVFSNHGEVSSSMADLTGLKAGTPVCYKAGDQPNNALSLNVLEPGEVAATAGTSGVVYSVSDQISYDPLSRVNTFAHVNHQLDGLNRLGTLLCINGTGILNRWMRDQVAPQWSYSQMNEAAASIQAGANGLSILPFGNGAERVLSNKTIHSTITGLNFNTHTTAHLIRAAQEGIAFSLKYGVDIMAETGTAPTVIRAGKANMFLSDVFTKALVNTIGVAVELYDTDGAKGAALGAGIGKGFFSQPKEAFENMESIGSVEPEKDLQEQYQHVYSNWKSILNKQLH
ncbi:FGGY family carbohydrate kinase [Flectobacillus sp. DC10W]|jgi:xylulokinase|uniref:FGGY family carbohydrate kinase n=1 Tax=Flectobacillus longus TaxID=2984207 RepID=A0ABT6YI74_9BACT|nr:FGGY family carbohydrate kinase [Flectobacillus longus]MDI9863301.1 FGGY family carbohydrate kinase [Flectobacillus longus]